MYRSSEQDLAFKYGDHGPGYLLRGPGADVGIIVLRPGDDYRNHYHAKSENVFLTLEGRVTLWSDCRSKLSLGPGELYRCDPGEMHYLVNEGTERWRAVFIRVPFDPSDTVPVEWRPGEPPPSREPA